MLKEHQSRKRYPSDLTDEQWTPGGAAAPPAKPRQRRRGARARSICGQSSTRFGISTGSGCQWDRLPHDLPPQEYGL